MKTPVIAVLLTASLAANAWLLGLRPANETRRDENKSVASDVRTSAGTTASATPRPVVWQDRGLSLDDTRALAADLRAAGFPDRVVAKFVTARLRERVAAELAKFPYWQLMGNGREIRKLRNELDAEIARQQLAILGEAGTPAALLDPMARETIYGGLSDAIANKLLGVQRDYREMTSETMVSGEARTGAELQTRRQQFQTLERERYADFKTAMSSEEFAEFEARNSVSAARVQDGLTGLAISEVEYRALYAAQRAREPNADEFGGYSRNEVSTDLAATLAFNEQLRATLGAERADAFLKNTDRAYAQAAAFAEKTPGFPREKLDALYRLQSEASVARQQSSRRPSENGALPDFAAERAKSEELNRRLETLLGPEAADAYRRTGGGVNFNRSRPRTSPTPAARPPGGG